MGNEFGKDIKTTEAVAAAAVEKAAPAPKAPEKQPEIASYDDITKAWDAGQDYLLLNELLVLRNFHDGNFAKKDVKVVNASVRDSSGAVKKLAGVYLASHGLSDEDAEDIVLAENFSDGRVKIVSRYSAVSKLFG